MYRHHATSIKLITVIGRSVRGIGLVGRNVDRLSEVVGVNGCGVKVFVHVVVHTGLWVFPHPAK